MTRGVKGGAGWREEQEGEGDGNDEDPARRQPRAARATQLHSLKEELAELRDMGALRSSVRSKKHGRVGPAGAPTDGKKEKKRSRHEKHRKHRGKGKGVSVGERVYQTLRMKKKGGPSDRADPRSPSVGADEGAEKDGGDFDDLRVVDVTPSSG